MLKTRNEPTEEEKNLEICTEELTSAKLLPSRTDRRTGNRAQVDHRPYHRHQRTRPPTTPPISLSPLKAAVVTGESTICQSDDTWTGSSVNVNCRRRWEKSAGKVSDSSTAYPFQTGLGPTLVCRTRVTSHGCCLVFLWRGTFPVVHRPLLVHLHSPLTYRHFG